MHSIRKGNDLIFSAVSHQLDLGSILCFEITFSSVKSPSLQFFPVLYFEMVEIEPLLSVIHSETLWLQLSKIAELFEDLGGLRSAIGSQGWGLYRFRVRIYLFDTNFWNVLATRLECPLVLLWGKSGWLGTAKDIVWCVTIPLQVDFMLFPIRFTKIASHLKSCFYMKLCFVTWILETNFSLYFVKWKSLLYTNLHNALQFLILAAIN